MSKKIYFTGQGEEQEPILEKPSADVLFMSGAIRAAQNSSPVIREKILQDISLHMDASPESLEFMFTSDNNNNDHTVFDFPDSERRRKCIQDNLLDAAE